MEVLTLLLIGVILLMMGVMMIACFIIGAKVGQKVTKGEPIEVPKPDPMKAYRERQERKEAEREQDRLDTIMRNIENYDGTGYGQEDVPRG